MSSLKDMLTIMVVDDHISSRMVTLNGLQQLGIKNLHTAKDGREAFTKMVTNPVHLLITDLYMPEVDGFKLIQAIRNHPQIRRTAAIILTGRKDEKVVNTAKRLGVNNVIAKPFEPATLRGAIESVVGKLG